MVPTPEHQEAVVLVDIMEMVVLVVLIMLLDLLAPVLVVAVEERDIMDHQLLFVLAVAVVQEF
jgi:hypothetical protein